MKKFITIATISVPLLLCCACDNVVANSSLKLYIEEIKTQFKIDEKNENQTWSYTYQNLEPKREDACIVDFYVFESTNTHSHWYCHKVQDKIDCKVLWIKRL